MPIDLRKWPPLVTHFIVATVCIIATVRMMAGPTSDVELKENEWVWRLPRKMLSRFPEESGSMWILVRDGQRSWCQASHVTGRLLREGDDGYLMLPATGDSAVWFQVLSSRGRDPWRVVTEKERREACGLPRVVYGEG